MHRQHRRRRRADPIQRAGLDVRCPRVLKIAAQKLRKNLGDGPSTVKGVHHIGFYVDDLEEACTTIAEASATECPGSSKVNRKYKGPDGVMIDLRARGWDEQIKARMQLYQLTPVPAEPRRS